MVHIVPLVHTGVKRQRAVWAVLGCYSVTNGQCRRHGQAADFCGNIEGYVSYVFEEGSCGNGLMVGTLRFAQPTLAGGEALQVLNVSVSDAPRREVTFPGLRFAPSRLRLLWAFTPFLPPANQERILPSPKHKRPFAHSGETSKTANHEPLRRIHV